MSGQKAGIRVKIKKIKQKWEGGLHYLGMSLFGLGAIGIRME